MSAITQRAMLAAVHISVWTARKHDRRVSRQVANQHQSNEKLGRYTKRLLTEAPKLEQVHTLVSHIRGHFYHVTLPWSDEGLRILPADLFFEFSEKFREFEYEFNNGVEDFLAAYPEYVDADRPKLNGLFCDDDYPTVKQLREKFKIKLDIVPIPSGDDFRVQLSDDQKKIVAAEIDTRVRETLAESNRDLWYRMYDVVAHFANRVGDPDARLHSSVLANMEEMASLLPRLNISNDPALNDMAQQVKVQLCQHSVGSLRDDRALRKDTAAKASAIVRQLGASLNEPANAEEAETAEAAQPQPAPAMPVDAILARMSAYMGNPVCV